MTALVAAVITAAMALIVALVTQYMTSRRERELRTWSWQREALLDAQDAALALRGRLTGYGAALAEARMRLMTTTPVVATDVRLEVDRDADTDVADAQALLEVRVARIADPILREDLARWRTVATEALVATAEDTPRSMETEHWRVLNVAIGVALQGPSGRPANRAWKSLSRIVFL